MVVECWCGLVEKMDRRALNAFTRDIWARFDHRDLELLKEAIVRRREALTTTNHPDCRTAGASAGVGADP
jgi:hypothetical protein